MREDDLVNGRIGRHVRLASDGLIRIKGVEAERKGRAIEGEPLRSEFNISDNSPAMPAFDKKEMVRVMRDESCEIMGNGVQEKSQLRCNGNFGDIFF